MIAVSLRRAAALAFVAVVAALGAGAAEGQVKAVTGDPVVAIVDGAAIHRSELLQMQESLPEDYQKLPLDVLYPVMIERLIDARLIVNAGRKENLQNEAEVRRRVAAYEERVIQEAYLIRRIETEVTDDKLRQRFEQALKDSPPKPQIHARHILVRTETQARDILAQLAKGKDFAALAGELSVDPSGKQNGGDLGFFSAEEMVPEFAKAAFALKDGETTKEPVKSQFGWHIIRVEGRRESLPTFEESKEQIQAEVSQEVVKKLVASLREGAKVEKFGPDGLAATAPAAPAAPAAPPAATPAAPPAAPK